ncbi:MAG TPA: hypothetical protein DCL44_00975 [Elusimicrobia bacterium]|nr:hypothetical protein [Elusimicrobiota bacterium]
MNGTCLNEKLFWNNRARNYPLPFESENLKKTNRILRILRIMGAHFEGRRVLDIGCGTGVYALPLAGKAKSVLGLDSSPAMLKIFRAECRNHDVTNASCVLSSWAAIPSARLAGRFDIALASMTMAIKNKTDLLKMEKTSRESCVYIGWAGVRNNILLKKVYAKHGIKYRAPQGSEIVLKILEELERKPAVRFIRDSWERKASPAETMRDIEVGLKVNGTKMDRAWVESQLNKLVKNGMIRQLTSIRKALITWPVP